jgi:hypothetical protein
MQLEQEGNQETLDFKAKVMNVGLQQWHKVMLLDWWWCKPSGLIAGWIPVTT